jgi:dipeptide/tripeptide permease
MNACTRWSAIVIAVLGVVCLVFGIIFIAQAGSSEKEIAESIQPVTLTELDATYEAVKTSQMAKRAEEEPGIQAMTAAPSATYNYLTIQRTALGLARTNVGLASFVKTSGIIGIIVGLGLILAGVGLFKKSRSQA